MKQNTELSSGNDDHLNTPKFPNEDLSEWRFHRKLPKRVRIITPTEELFLIRAAREELAKGRLPPSRRARRDGMESESPRGRRKEKSKSKKNKKSKTKKNNKSEEDIKDGENIKSQKKSAGRFAFVGAWFERRKVKRKQKTSKVNIDIASPRNEVDFYDIFAAGEDTVSHKGYNSAADVTFTEVQPF